MNPRRRSRKENRLLFRTTEDAIFPLPDTPEGPALVLGLNRCNTEARIGYRTCPAEVESARETVPYRTPVLAVRSGVITAVVRTPEGLRIWIDHRNGFHTGYEGLIGSDFRTTNWCRHGVTRGQVIGYVGGDDDQPLRPLRFSIYKELTHGVPGLPRAIDPMIVLPCWRHLSLAREALECVTGAASTDSDAA